MFDSEARPQVRGLDGLTRVEGEQRTARGQELVTRIGELKAQGLGRARTARGGEVAAV